MSSPCQPTAESGGDEQNDSTLPQLKDFLDADPRPTFIVPIDPAGPVSFELLLCNGAFDHEGLSEEVLQDAQAALRFRSWCQIVMHCSEEYEFAGVTWTAFKIQDRWKCIRALGPKVTDPKEAADPKKMDPHGTKATQDEARTTSDVHIADARLAVLNKMMEMSDVGTFEYTPQGRLLRANESWYRLSQHPRGVALHRDYSFMELVYPPDAELCISQWSKLVQGIPLTFEMRWKGRNYRDAEEGVDAVDDAQWVLSACVPILDEDGNVVSVAGNTIDINAQKRVQEDALKRAEALERARASEHKFSRFALLAPVAILIIDPQKRMTYCNNRFFELTGDLIVDDYENIDWQTIVYPEDQHVVDKQWANLFSDSKCTQAHFRLNHTWDLGDGTPRQVWVESQAIPELDDEGNIVSIFGTMTDISRFKWAEEIQRSRIEEVLESKRKHENFIDMTSHEMRNPLSAVVQCADSTIDSLQTVQSLVSKCGPPDTSFVQRVDNELKACLDSLSTIVSCSLHQKRVIDDILSLSKMDANLMVISPVRVEPAVVVAEAVHMFEVECNKDKIDLRFIEDPSLKSAGAQYVMMDPSRVLQVLINLITNAIKFTRNRPTRRVEVSLGACLSRPLQGSYGVTYVNVAADASDLLANDEWGVGPEVYIWIKCRDTGCGLTKDEQSDLFTRFSQATPRTHIHYGGSGLGLFISKKLTELQGGAIGLQSEPNVGSTFTFFVATRIASAPMPTKLGKTKKPTVRRTASTRTDVHGQPQFSVLIVEDNLINQKVLSLQLRKAGYEVHVTNNGVEALDFLRTTEHWATSATATNRCSVSAILMDVEMPVMDGLTCAQKIREYQRAGDIVGHIPIIAVSANARSEQMAQAREAGMDDAISKPFRMFELLPRLDALAKGGVATP